MPTETKSTAPSLKDIIKANVAGEVAEEFHNALEKGNNKILSFWSLDNDTVNKDPLNRYHVGHLAYMLFITKLLSTRNCVVEANICDSYSLKSNRTERHSSFFNLFKSWREGRIRIRNFLDRVYLEAEDNFIIFNLRDEFQKRNSHFQKLYTSARDVWAETKDLLDRHGRELVDGRDYRYPNKASANDTHIRKFHNLLRKKLWGGITTLETKTLLFISDHDPSWLTSDWTSKCIALFASKFIKNKHVEYILEGERNCYSWRFHLLLAKIVAVRNAARNRKPPDFTRIQIIPFRDIPNIENSKFMAQEQKDSALFFEEILNATETTNKFHRFRSKSTRATNRIYDLLQSLEAANPISSFVFNIAAKLCDYPTDSVQILHVSDIHYGRHFSFGVKESSTKWSPVEKLTSYLQSRLSREKPHFLFISGDFTSVCKRREFAQAEDFIKHFLKSKVLQALPGRHRVWRHQIVAVPGNHDFAWDLVGKNQARDFKVFVKNAGIMSPWTDSSRICKIIKPANSVPLRMMYFERLGLAIVLACSTTGTLSSRDKREDYAKLRKLKGKLSDEQWNLLRELLNQDQPEFPPEHQAALSQCIGELYRKNGGQNAKLVFMAHHHVSDVDHETRSPRGIPNIMRTLVDANAVLWLHGHIHVPYLRTREDGLTICGAGTIGGWTAEGHSANIIHIGISNNYENCLSQLKFNMLDGSFRRCSFEEK